MTRVKRALWDCTEYQGQKEVVVLWDHRVRISSVFSIENALQKVKLMHPMFVKVTSFCLYNKIEDKHYSLSWLNYFSDHCSQGSKVSQGHWEWREKREISELRENLVRKFLVKAILRYMICIWNYLLPMFTLVNVVLWSLCDHYEQNVFFFGKVTFIYVVFTWKILSIAFVLVIGKNGTIHVFWIVFNLWRLS